MYSGKSLKFQSWPGIYHSFILKNIRTRKKEKIMKRRVVFGYKSSFKDAISYQLKI